MNNFNKKTVEELNKLSKKATSKLTSEINSKKSEKYAAHQKLNETRDGFGKIDDYSEVADVFLRCAVEQENEYINTVLITEQDKLNSCWADEWDKLNDMEKMIIGTLHWDKLQDTQKSEFNDHVLLEMSAMRQKRISETYTNPTKLRKYFLEKAGPVVDLMIKAALSDKKQVHINEYAMAEVWAVFKDVIIQAKDYAPLIDIKGKGISDQINVILTAVTKGKMTFAEAQEYMSLVSSGFNLQELPKLMEQLEKLET